MVCERAGTKGERGQSEADSFKTGKAWGKEEYKAHQAAVSRPQLGCLVLPAVSQQPAGAAAWSPALSTVMSFLW